MASDWREIERAPRGADEPRCDAFATWGFETGFRDAWPPEVRAGTVRSLWLVFALREQGAGWLHTQAALVPDGWLVVPGHYAKAPAWLQAARHGTAIASLDFIRYLIDPKDSLVTAVTPQQAASLARIRREIEAFEISLAGAGKFVEPPAHPAGDGGDVEAAPPSCVVAVIDDGLPFAHHRFCWQDENGRRRTRFLALWDQSSLDKPSLDWCLGRVLKPKEMDDAILDATRNGRVDEDAAYHLAGVAPLLRHRVTHGAHVLDLACGAATPASATAEPAIVGVQLRPMVSTLNLSPGAHLLDAIRFAADRADAACGGKPGCKVVVNASVGDIAGPHDGTSLFERAVDELVRLRRQAAPSAPLEVVLPEGNAYLSRCHAWSEMEAATALGLTWHLKPDDGTSSYLEIWLRPKGYKADAWPVDLDIKLTLRPPAPWRAVTVHRVRSGGANPGSIDAVLQDAGETIAVVSLHPQPANGRHWMGLVTVAPTAPYGPWTRCAPAGEWELVVEVGAASATVYCNVYSQRDEKSFGLRSRGRQAVLEDGYDRRLDRRGRLEREDGDTFRRRAGTINSLANGEEPHVVGGLRRLPGGALEPAPYSSVAIPPRRQRGPKLTLALTEDSPVLHGVLAAGSRSGSVVALSGTSMAAPQRARELAAPSGTGSMRLVVEDAVGVSRAVVPQAADLDRRSRRRRGEP